MHVGSPKTGTTFLQQVLWSQRDELKEQGLLLPGRGFNDHWLACMDLRERHEQVPQSEGVWERLVERTGEWDGDVLVSHELFAGARRRPIRRAVADLSEVSDEVHVVVTVRDLARQIPAEWQEHVKHRSTIRFADFVQAVRERGPEAQWFWLVQDFPRLVERWARHLPPERVHVVTVPPPSSGPDVLWGRFARTVGLEPAAFSLDVRRSNTSVGLEQAELVRRLNEELGERLTRQGAYSVLVKDNLAHDMLSQRPGTRLGLTRDEWDFAVEHAHGMVRDIKALGVDVVGDLQDLVPSGEPPTAESHAELAIERVLEEAVAALAASLEAHDRTRVKLQQARAGAPPPPPPAIDPDVNPVRRALVAASHRWTWADKAKRVYKKTLQRSPEPPNDDAPEAH
jgi:hypothetical protein